MAGDWIKMRSNLWDDPRVARLVDLTDSSEAAVIGGLYWLWATADQHTADGFMPGLSCRQIDRKTGVQGLGQALVDIGWIENHSEGVFIVNFEDHNGASAKKRAQTAKRVANHRSSNAPETPSDDSSNAPSVTGALAREREEKEEEIPPNPPCQGGEESDAPSAEKPKRERKERCSLKTFLDRCRAAGETAISGYEPLRKYVDGVELPMEFVQLAWDVFKGEHSPGGTNERRLQADWRKHFLNYVTKGYYRLWYADAEGQFALTTVGIQAQKLHARRDAA
ncbi:hypothetical protein [Achromobacter arsenitoxydans]|uniref:Uncharacterized protein n=1 Tax=Achromobacter arsenitoxydans SY8 TaxID=477184 RepID=H0F6R8_9BURK|nr:hypothetical protein [Achromobacter arsenitoxydans]EHK65976.1 hypothetical protein KYC_12643 [Achromobacter arsenitoxydans SY8]